MGRPDFQHAAARRQGASPQELTHSYEVCISTIRRANPRRLTYILIAAGVTT
jgi:hypothetical protein